MFIHSKVRNGVLSLVLLVEAGQGVVGEVAHGSQEIAVEGDKDNRVGHHLVNSDFWKVKVPFKVGSDRK